MLIHRVTKRTTIASLGNRAHTHPNIPGYIHRASLTAASPNESEGGGRLWDYTLLIRCNCFKKRKQTSESRHRESKAFWGDDPQSCDQRVVAGLSMRSGWAVYDSLTQLDWSLTCWFVGNVPSRVKTTLKLTGNTCSYSQHIQLLILLILAGANLCDFHFQFSPAFIFIITLLPHWNSPFPHRHTLTQ